MLIHVKNDNKVMFFCSFKILLYTCINWVKKNYCVATLAAKFYFQENTEQMFLGVYE